MGSRWRKWKTCCWVTVSGGRSSGTPRQPASSGSHAPAVTTTVAAATVGPSVCTGRPLPSPRPRAPGCGPGPAAPLPVRRTHAATAASASMTPASGWNSTGPSKHMPGQRASASSAASSSHGTPRHQQPAQRDRIARRAGVEATGGAQQGRSGVVLGHRPRVQRTPGQPHVERVGVGAAHDPLGAVRAAVPVAGLEALDQRDRDPAAGQLPRGGRPHQTRPDHGDVHPEVAHGVPPGIHDVPASGTRAIAAASTVSATRSSGSRWRRCALPQARARVCASIVRTLR